jgi:hypothetical protein
MLGWLRNLFSRSPQIIRVEVTVNVPEIRVFTVNSGEATGASTITKGGPVSQVEEGSDRFKSPPQLTDDDRLDQLAGKFGQLKTPQVNFGQDNK